MTIAAFKDLVITHDPDVSVLDARQLEAFDYHPRLPHRLCF
jgi:hypothetical protein